MVRSDLHVSDEERKATPFYYAGFAQQSVEKRHPGVQAMFMIGCGGSANPYPRGTVEAAQAHGESLGAEVCRVAGEKLATVGIVGDGIAGYGCPDIDPLSAGLITMELSRGDGSLATFVGVLAAFAARMAMAWRSMPADGFRAVELGCLAALAAALVSGVFDHYFFTYPHAFGLLWLIVGLAMSAIPIVDQKPN